MIEPRGNIVYRRARHSPDGIPRYELWAWGRMRAKNLTFGEVLTMILAGETPAWEDEDADQDRKLPG